MKHSITSLIITLAFIFSLAPRLIAQNSDSEKQQTELQKVMQSFSNLPLKKREEFGSKLLKTQNLFNQKRIFDALQEIEELDKIFPDHPSSLNLKGACYVELRAFDKAMAIFQKVLDIAPDNTNVQFNLAEVDFVTKQWQSSLDRFEKLIPLLPAQNKSMIRLCEFKQLLCLLKTDRVKEAIALKDKHDLWDDSPFYYYSRAAILYHQDNELGAEKMLRDARFVWKNDAALAPWQDTLIEYGYVRSFYGGDTQEIE